MSVSPNCLFYKWTEDWGDSVLCEPCIPLEGTYSFSAIYTNNAGGYHEYIGIAWSTFIKSGGSYIGDSGLNSWGYDGKTG